MNEILDQIDANKKAMTSHTDFFDSKKWGY